jgi:hypothetical protein
MGASRGATAWSRRRPAITSSARGWNLRDSDGTLIINRGRLDGGALLTAELALGRHRKALLIVQLGRRIRVRVLNVAGPRESKRPGIRRAAKALLMGLLGERGKRP